jgi:hypothetical protein
MARRTTARTTAPAWTPPMLAKRDGGRLPSGPQWSYEIKWDFCARFDLLVRAGDPNGVSC